MIVFPRFDWLAAARFVTYIPSRINFTSIYRELSPLTNRYGAF